MNEVSTDVIKTALAYAQAIRAFQILEPKAKWFEKMLIRLLRKSYQQRLRYFMLVLPSEIMDEILGATQDE